MTTNLLPPGAPEWWPVVVWAGDLHVAADGAGRGELEHELDMMGRSGVDAVVVPALREGVFLYDTSLIVGPRRPYRRRPWEKVFGRNTSPFSHALQLAAEAGMRAWAQIDLLVGGRVHFPTPSISRLRPRWTVRNARGRATPIGDDAEFTFICPANADAMHHIGEIAVDLVERHAISALVVDLRSLPNDPIDAAPTHCFCFHCLERAARDLGLDLQEALEVGTPEVWAQWRAWRSELYADALRMIHARIWAAKPGIPVFARVEAALPRTLSHNVAAAAPQRRRFLRRPATRTGAPAAPPTASAPAAPPSATPSPATTPAAAVPPLTAGMPFWVAWAREGIVDGLMVELPPGRDDVKSPHEAVSAICGSMLDLPIIPLVNRLASTEAEAAIVRDWAVTATAIVGVSKHLSELPDDITALRRAAASAPAQPPAPPAAPPPQPPSSTLPTEEEPAPPRIQLEASPFLAALSVMHATREVLELAPETTAIGHDLALIQNALESDPETPSSLEALETIDSQLLALAATLRITPELPEEIRELALGWLSLARALLRWHGNQSSVDVKTFDLA